MKPENTYPKTVTFADSVCIYFLLPLLSVLTIIFCAALAQGLWSMFSDDSQASIAKIASNIIIFAIILVVYIKLFKALARPGVEISQDGLVARNVKYNATRQTFSIKWDNVANVTWDVNSYRITQDDKISFNLPVLGLNILLARSGTYVDGPDDKSKRVHDFIEYYWQKSSGYSPGKLKPVDLDEVPSLSEK